VRFAQERTAAVLGDLCGCPGLFAGQYEDLDLLPDDYVTRLYEGGAGFMGLAKAYPTEKALGAYHHAELLKRYPSLASAIEAATAGETGNTGSTEGESAVAESETPQ
jgi:hypothetical protein